MKCPNKNCKSFGKELGPDRRTCPDCKNYLDRPLANARNQRARARAKAGGTGVTTAGTAPPPATHEGDGAGAAPSALPKPDEATTAEAFPASWEDYKKAKSAEKVEVAKAAGPVKPVVKDYKFPVRLICIEVNKHLEKVDQLSDAEIEQLEAAADSLGFGVEQRSGEPIVLPWFVPVLVAVAIVAIPRLIKVVPGLLKKWRERGKKADESATGA